MQNYKAKFKKLNNIISGKIIYLATADKFSTPNIIAAEVNKITPNGEIIITDNQMRRTPKNIIAIKRAVILFTDNRKIWWRISGKANYYKKGEHFEFVKHLKSNKKYQPKGAVVIKIKRIDDLNTSKLILNF